MTKTPFETLLDSPELAEVLAMPEIAPGCNMPCISVSERHPGLWAYNVEATETGLVAALSGRESDSDRFQHLVFFPTFSTGTLAFFRIKPGQKVTVDAAAEDTLKVITEQGEATFPGKIVVIVHDSLDQAAVEAFYS